MTLPFVGRKSCFKMQVNEFELLVDYDGKIVEAVYNGKVLRPGIKVVHVGNCIAIPNNISGKIENLSRPYQQNHTTNIVNVIFENSPLVWKMRPEEIHIP